MLARISHFSERICLHFAISFQVVCVVCLLKIMLFAKTFTFLLHTLFTFPVFSHNFFDNFQHFSTIQHFLTNFYTFRHTSTFFDTLRHTTTILDIFSTIFENFDFSTFFDILQLFSTFFYVFRQFDNLTFFDILRHFSTFFRRRKMLKNVENEKPRRQMSTSALGGDLFRVYREGPRPFRGS